MVPLLFEATATDFSTRGLFALSDAISCTVTEERNGLFELELVYPTDGNHFSEILEDRLIVAFPHENGTKQAFRIYRREASIEGTVTFYARHISYQLSFIPVDLCSGQTDSAQTMMETLAQAAQVACPFSFESDITTAAALSFAVTAPVGFRSALGGMEGSVLDHFGGEFEWDNWTVKLLENRGADSGVRIAYGKNITEYDDALDIGDTITGVMAYYAYTDENEQAQIVYTNPKVITNESTEFAHERIAPLDCSGEFDSVPTVQALTDYATLWLHRTSNADPTQEINVSFVPLGQTAEYTGLAELERVSLCDTVKVSYPALGISVKKKVTRTVWNVLTNSYDEITLGTEQTLADTIVDLQSGESSSSGGGVSEEVVRALIRDALADYSEVVDGTFTQDDSSTSYGGDCGIKTDGHIAQLVIGVTRTYQSNQYTRIATVTPAPPQNITTITTAANGVAVMIQITSAGVVNVFPYNSNSVGWIRTAITYFV